MTRKSKTEQKVGQLARERFDPSRLHETLAEINAGSDRSAVIVWGALIDDALHSAILRMMRTLTELEEKELFDPDRPLGELGAKIKVAYAMEVIDKRKRDDLVRISKIRNAFAHNPFS